MPERSPLVEARDLGFSYGEAPLFRHVNLEIFSGEFIGLIGGNGSGKSTLLKVLLGLESATEGECFLFGKPSSQFRDWGRIGYLSQRATAFNTAFPATVEEVVLSGLSHEIGLLRRPRQDHRQRVREALRLVGMEEKQAQRVGHLSGGQQQRVFIARLLVTRPELIFLDEPTVGIDVKNVHEIYRILHQLNEEQGMAIVLVSHDMDAILQHSQRQLNMEENNIW